MNVLENGPMPKPGPIYMKTNRPREPSKLYESYTIGPYLRGKKDKTDKKDKEKKNKPAVLSEILHKAIQYETDWKSFPKTNADLKNLTFIDHCQCYFRVGIWLQYVFPPTRR